jgi:hypothetical protein
MLVCIFYGHLVYFEEIWLYFSRFGMLYQEKSGNPVREVRPFCSNKLGLQSTVTRLGENSPNLVTLLPRYFETKRNEIENSPFGGAAQWSSPPELVNDRGIESPPGV